VAFDAQIAEVLRWRNSLGLGSVFLEYSESRYELNPVERAANVVKGQLRKSRRRPCGPF